MKNNVIAVLVDSVTWESVGTTRCKVSPTPFLDSLKSESITASHLYSHGPYTDAATRSLFTGRNCLDDFGYFFRINASPVNHYQLFHDAGYEVYDFHYPFYILDNNVHKSIDHTIYTSGFVYGSEWGGWYKYFHELVKTRPLTDEEYLLLGARLFQMFESWEYYFMDILRDPECMSIHGKALQGYDVEQSLNILREEFAQFKKQRKVYIDNFLDQGLEHKLASLDTTNISTYINPDFYKNYIEPQYNKLFRRITINNIKANAVRNLPSLKRLWHGFKEYRRTKDKNSLKFIENYFLSLTPMIVMKKRWKKPGWQNGHSARTDYSKALEIIKKRGTYDNKPFYMFFHVGEPHNNIAFFSYDMCKESVIDEEMAMLKDYVEQLGTSFKGSLPYILSVRYSDYQLQKLCEGLKELGVWDKTTLLVYADHGSSYTYYPLHNQRVNNFDDECYHIPMLLRSPGLKGREITTYQYSKDIYPTLCDVVGISPSEFFKGRSMLRETQIRPCIVTEYMGPGCPDILTRKIWFSARDSKYIIAYKACINEDFDKGELAEVYDLKEDPNGFYNICSTVDRSTIQYLLDPIRSRFEEIKTDSFSFIKNLRESFNYDTLTFNTTI